MKEWASRNRPIIAAMAAALTPIVTFLLVGDVQAALDAWPMFAQVLGPVVVGLLFAYLFGAVAQGGTDDPIIGQPLAQRASRMQIGTMPMTELLSDGPDTPSEAAEMFAVYYEENPEALEIDESALPVDEMPTEEFLANFEPSDFGIIGEGSDDDGA